MINRLFVFTRAAASGATATTFLCAYHCYHYTNECSEAARAAMLSLSLYSQQAEDLERNVKVFRTTSESRLSQQKALAARQQAQH